MNRDGIGLQELLTLHEAPILAFREREPKSKPQIEVTEGPSRLLH